MTNNTEKPLYSHHIFLFPFKWDYLPAGKKLSKASFIERTSFDKFLQVIKDSPWLESPFQIHIDEADKYHTFNEYNYFHGYVRDALAITLNEQETTRRFRYPLPDKGEQAIYEITVKNEKKPNSIYRLKIKDILLTTYDIGIGFLAFFLENRQTSDPEDLLRINDFGRRIYPQFLGYVSNEEKERAKDDPKKKEPTSLDGPKSSFLADTIKLIGFSNEPIGDDFSYYEDLKSLNGEPFKLPKFISHLLGSKFAVSTRKSKQHMSQDKILLSPLVDDRMYVQSYSFASSGMDHLQQYDSEKGKYSYVNDDFWYAYLFVDSSLDVTCKSRPMKEQLLEKHTYDRWLERRNEKGESQSQLFGISRYSFVMLVEKNWFTENILINHYKYLYFQMMALALMQRAAILRFAAEAATISEAIKTSKDASYQKRIIREIYKGYLYFTNKIYFREITPQEQGIELYDKMRDVMEIDTDLTALQQEIAELHQYSVLLEGEKNSREAELLTWIATMFLPPTLVAAVFGFSNLPDTFSFSSSLVVAALASALLIIVLIAIIVLVRLRVFLRNK